MATPTTASGPNGANIPPDDMPFTVEEIAARERVSERTVRNWCTGGLIPAYKAGRQWRIERHYRDALREGNTADL